MGQPPQDPQARQQYIEQTKTRFTTSRIIEFLGALTFIIFGALTARDLYNVIWKETMHWRSYFDWTYMDKLIKYWPILVASGVIFYIARSFREHYEMVLIEAGVRN